MNYIGLIVLFLIMVNVFFTYKGLKNREVFEGLSFSVDSILLYKEYKRLITSGFLHVNWLHLFFNMYALLTFSISLELVIDGEQYIFVYFTSLIGGSLFSLFIYRNHGDYTAVGASGAVCGIIFASIALIPGLSVSMFFLPFHIPGWLFGILFVAYSIYGIRSRRDNIGHEAHLGGALIGMTAAILVHPVALLENYITIAVIVVPSVLFIYLIITRPYILLVDNLFYKKHPRMHVAHIDHSYNLDKAELQRQVDTILEKVSKKGMKSLTKKEKDLLYRHSGTL